MNGLKASVSEASAVAASTSTSPAILSGFRPAYSRRRRPAIEWPTRMNGPFSPEAATSFSKSETMARPSRGAGPGGEKPMPARS